MPTPSLLPYRITICGLSELSGHCSAGVSHVVSILDPDCPDPEDFLSYGRHAREVWRFHDTILDHPATVPPSEETLRAILAFGEAALRERAKHVLIHCHAGVSRSTAAAVALMVQNSPGREEEAFAHLRTIRPRSWPNSRMIRYADSLLGCGGALVAAMRAHHALVARAYPAFVELLKAGERAHEVPQA
ncbi:tyrosine phosphatase family protein [Telmatospirillum sp. J64-1]|uniref:tyrosine phosphatase family protein n=1 Tax=Telmatospirillum sp. J64-1 TaxID=2502183 RepID=UPI00115EA3E3|nr:dual specificity protein phosphatase family protein [Telmatospirillum sp. J64-1]